MGASNTLKMLARGDIEAARGIEAVAFEAEKFVLVTDDEDTLYCPGVIDEPSEGLVQSMRNGWLSGSVVICVNRGSKGGAPIPVVVAGRSRVKAAVKVNKERAARGVGLIKPEAVFVSAEEATDLMYLENNKQERAPTFDARRWVHFKKIFVRDGLVELAERTGKKGATDEEVAGLESEARASYAVKTNCKSSAFKRWELIMSAHPNVLLLCDQKAPGINLSAVKDIVESTSYEAQPDAARRIVDLAKGRKGEPEVVQLPTVQPTQDTPASIAPGVSAPEKQERRTRSEREDRKKALGIAAVKSRKVNELRDFAAAIERADGDDPMLSLASVILRYAANDDSVKDDPMLGFIFETAKKNGWKQ